MVRTRTIIIAAIASAITEGVLFALFVLIGRIGPDGPDTGTMVMMVLHLPGIIAADAFGLVGISDTMVIVVIAFLQYLVAFSVIITVFRRWQIHPSNTPEPDGTAGSRGDGGAGGPGGGWEEHH